LDNHSSGTNPPVADTEAAGEKLKLLDFTQLLFNSKE
jgi:hypothetical protein